MSEKILILRQITFIALILWTGSLKGETFKILTWNIKDLGKSKDDQEIQLISQVINDYDVIAIQEVVAKDPRGAQAVARIVENLNRMGNSWDYRISDPTKSPSSQMSERYAFIWKTSKIQILGRPSLDQELEQQCIREPYIGKFKLKGGKNTFYLVNFHSRKYNDKPEEEIQYFEKYQEKYGTELVFIAGDFNLNENHVIWNRFYRKGYKASIINSPTTLKMKCVNGNYLNHSIDNIYYDQDVVKVNGTGRVDFVKDCGYLKIARLISDHLPVFIECEIDRL